MSQIATHDGSVVAVEKNRVTVEMHVLSACSSCKAHEKCAFVDKADKVVMVDTDQWQQYSVGERVIVSVNESLGLLAVLLAYLLPALLLVAAIVVLSALSVPEAMVALATLLIVTAYFLLLWRFHSRLQRKFSFGIRKIDD